MVWYRNDKSDSPKGKDEEIPTGLCPSKRSLQGLNALSGKAVGFSVLT